MSQHFVTQVNEFHTAFKVKPKSLIHNLELRTKLLWEEYNEWKDSKSPEEELDALTDMVYIAAGTIDQYDPLIYSSYDQPTIYNRPVADIMNDIEFTVSYFAWVNFHVELIEAIQAVAREKNYDLVGAFNEVHSSNMSKLDENGKPIFRHDGKVLKGPNYRPPRLEKFTVLETK